MQTTATLVFRGPLVDWQRRRRPAGRYAIAYLQRGDNWGDVIEQWLDRLPDDISDEAEADLEDAYHAAVERHYRYRGRAIPWDADLAEAYDFDDVPVVVVRIDA